MKAFWVAVDPEGRHLGVKALGSRDGLRYIPQLHPAQWSPCDTRRAAICDVPKRYTAVSAIHDAEITTRHTPLPDVCRAGFDQWLSGWDGRTTHVRDAASRAARARSTARAARNCTRGAFRSSRAARAAGDHAASSPGTSATAGPARDNAARTASVGLTSRPTGNRAGRAAGAGGAEAGAGGAVSVHARRRRRLSTGDGRSSDRGGRRTRE